MSEAATLDLFRRLWPFGRREEQTPRRASARSRRLPRPHVDLSRLGPALAGVRALALQLVGPLRIITPLGWVATAGGAAMLVAGLTFGWAEAFAIGCIGLVAALAAVVWTLGRADYRAEIDLDARRVKVGDQVLGRVRVTNLRRRQLLGSTIELPVGRSVASFALPSLAHEQAHEQIFTVPTRRRAVITIGPVSSVRSDPLALVRRVRAWCDPVEVFVHPRTVPLSTGLTGFLKDVEGITTHDLSSSDVAFHALREYVPGDDRRAIHWRTTARLGKLMVRQFEETKRTHLLIVLSLNPADYADADEFETAVSTAGSLVLQGMRDERQVSLVSHDGVVAERSGTLVLDELSRIDVRPKASSFHLLASQAVLKVPECSVVALVTGSAVAPAELRLSRTSLPLEVGAFAVRCAGQEPASRRSLTDLTVLDVPALDDLPRALRSLK